MTLSDYLKERMGFLLINIITCGVILSLMNLLKTSIVICIIFCLIWFAPLVSYMMLEFIKYKKYYHELEEVFENLDRKYLLAEVMEPPSFSEGKLFYDILKKSNKVMHEEINHYQFMQQDYKEYIESWIHEIKTPIAGINLMIENNKSPVTSKIELEMQQVEKYIEQALYYARSNDVSKDYMIKPFVLRKAVMTVIQSNSRLLIGNAIMPELGELDEIVYSDFKWITFILNQIIGNSIKYTNKQKGCIKINAKTQNHSVILIVQDDGIGINEKDLGRVFDKGFTGENGRRITKSTGIGLYLCKKLCDRLGIGLTIESVYKEGTTVKLIFPVDNAYNR